jgi:perforin 1
MKLSSSTYRSSEALVTSSSSSVTNDWKVNLDLATAGNTASLMLAGTDSKLAQYSMEKTKSDKFSFTSQSISCEYYRYGQMNTREDTFLCTPFSHFIGGGEFV